MKKIVKISLLLCISSLMYSFTPEEEARIQHYVKNPKETEGFWNSVHKVLGTKTGKIIEEAERRRNNLSSSKTDTITKGLESSKKNKDPFEGFDYTGGDFDASKKSFGSEVQKPKEEASGKVADLVAKTDSPGQEKSTFNLDKVQDDQEVRQADEVALETKEKTAQSETKDIKLAEAEKVVTVDFSDKSNDTSNNSKKRTKKKIKKKTQKIDLDELSELLNIDPNDIQQAQKEKIDRSLQKMIDASSSDPLYHMYNEFLQKHLSKIPGKFVAKFFEKFDQDISISIVNTMSLENIQYIPKDYFEKQDDLYKETKTALPVFDKDKQLFIDIVKKGIESISPKDIENMDPKTRAIFVKNLSPENTQKLSADQIKKVLHDTNAQNSLKVADLSSENLAAALTKGTFATKEISLTPEFKKSLSSSQLDAVLKVSVDKLRLSTLDYQDIAKRLRS